MWLGRTLIKILGPLVRLIMRVREVGVENFPSDSTSLILCSNHISNWDPVILITAKPHRHIYFMAKSELFCNRLFSWFLGKQLGAFPVHRGTGDTDALNTAETLVKEGKILGIFPEGTRSKTGKLLRPKSGVAFIAAKTGAHVLPVAIVTRNQRVRLFKRITIVYGKPLSAEELHLADAEHPDIRFATRRIMEAISQQIEEYE